ncbi:Isoepoxydon dehydrogenase patN [Paramyrothecium foliicola]|nr:Isoepoxydon dehydrogenase patN [Paramyrothecium foliicola]
MTHKIPLSSFTLGYTNLYHNHSSTVCLNSPTKIDSLNTDRHLTEQKGTPLKMARFSTQVSGYHVLVTGGTKGIGKSVVEEFLAEGANVSYCARTVRGDEFAGFKDATNGARAVGTQVDITDLPAIASWVEKSAKEFGRINVVVANAHTGEGKAEIESWRHKFEGDILGLITLIESATPHLAAQAGDASIVVISSLAGYETRHPDVAGPYSTLKRAQATLAKDYSRKLLPIGIRINTVAPGFVLAPDITHPDGTVELSTLNRAKDMYPEFIAQIEEVVPLKRAGTVEEISNTVLFLASRLSGYTAGATLIIDGGVSLTM